MQKLVNLLLFHFDGGRHSRQPKTRSLKVNFGKLDSTLSHLFSVLGCYRTIHTGLCLWKVESCPCMWEQSRWKSFKPSLIYLLPPLLTIDYGFYLPPLIEIERRSQVGMIPEVSIDFVFHKGQKKIMEMEMFIFFWDYTFR